MHQTKSIARSTCYIESRGRCERSPSIPTLCASLSFCYLVQWKNSYKHGAGIKERTFLCQVREVAICSPSNARRTHNFIQSAARSADWLHESCAEISQTAPLNNTQVNCTLQLCLMENPERIVCADRFRCETCKVHECMCAGERESPYLMHSVRWVIPSVRWLHVTLTIHYILWHQPNCTRKAPMRFRLCASVFLFILMLCLFFVFPSLDWRSSDGAQMHQCLTATDIFSKRFRLRAAKLASCL